MRRMKLFCLTQLLTVLVLIGIVANVGPPIFAGFERETVIRLDGYHIYFSEADREAGPFDRTDEGASRLAGLLSNLGAHISILDWRVGIPEDADLVIMAGPVRYVSTDECARLWHYLSSGGAVLLVIDPLLETTDEYGNLVTSLNRSIATEFFDLTWQDFGISARGDVVVTESTAAGLNADIVTSVVDAAHPITAHLREPLAFFSARSFAFDASIQDYRTTALAFSDDDYYGEASYAAYLLEGTATLNIGVDTPRGPLALAVAAENLTTGGRLVLIGDRDFMTNGKGLQTAPSNTAGFLYPGNVYFLLNAMAWLVGADSAQTSDLAFPTPGPTATATVAPTPAPLGAGGAN